MPYCCQCGTQVGEQIAFCANCGTRQPQTSATAGKDVFSGLTSQQTSALCYIPFAGWVASVVILATDRFRREERVRFHAFQGLYLFVAWLMVEMVLQPLFHAMPGMGPAGVVPKLLKLAIILAWIMMLIKTLQGANYRLPLLGELAEKSVAEQL